MNERKKTENTQRNKEITYDMQHGNNDQLKKYKKKHRKK